MKAWFKKTQSGMKLGRIKQSTMEEVLQKIN